MEMTGLVEMEHWSEDHKLVTYSMYDPKEKGIWIDITYFPTTCLLCALFDGTPYMKAAVGDSQDDERVFLPMDWLLEEWGGEKEIIAALKIAKPKILKRAKKYLGAKK